jgi:phosphate transport system permease protein
MMWLTGGALVICLVMIAGLLGLIFAQGIGTFWPREIVRVATLDGDVYMGEVTRSEEFRVTEELIGTFTDDKAERPHG